ncbi:MAG: hypothetical protein ABGY29_06130, partial [bacterium]
MVATIPQVSPSPGLEFDSGPGLVVAASVMAIILCAELLHLRRLLPVARLAFGPKGQPAAWVRMVPFLRALAGGALAWGLITLWSLIPKVHSGAGGAFGVDDAIQNV